MIYQMILGLPPHPSFKFQVKTDNAGTSNDDQFTLPLKAGETYNCQIDWESDGVSVTQQTTDVSPTHTFAGGAGTYTISITGTFPAIYFANGGDKLKILQIQQWGDVAWGTMNDAFYGCSNMTMPATDVPDLSAVLSMEGSFYDCASFNQPMPWDVSGVTNMNAVLRGCTAFNQPLPWDVSSVTTMRFMIYQCTAFNQPLPWDVSSVTDMYIMLAECVAFDQSLASLDVSSVTDMTSLLWGVTLSTANYDALLIAWNALALQNSVPFHGGNSTYTQTSVDSGTTDGTTASHLIDSAKTFTATVNINDIAHNTTDDTYAKVTNVADTDLTLDANIMVSGENYVIQSSAAAKARYNMLSSDGWTIVDGGPV